ncbi:hypothetical protein ACJ73_01517 [Blastomyces percursus]|uniref:Uncharacterized protein n=1 Tax=Blastomyces percursus TaxID=1658174 RepID=A0A1J9R3Z0_9EURO|nr:hypothetical protein ACJ73_01517 [Blastomyces percursus]
MIRRYERNFPNHPKVPNIEHVEAVVGKLVILPDRSRFLGDQIGMAIDSISFTSGYSEVISSGNMTSNVELGAEVNGSRHFASTYLAEERPKMGESNIARFSAYVEKTPSVPSALCWVPCMPCMYIGTLSRQYPKADLPIHHMATLEHMMTGGEHAGLAANDCGANLLNVLNNDQMQFLDF